MSACEKCWGDAFMRTLGDPTKAQADHYRDLLEERKDRPCSEEEQRNGRQPFGGKMNEQEHLFVEQFKEQQRINFKINMEHGFEGEWSIQHGFEEPYNVSEKIALMHSELSEALEYFRKDPDAPSNHIPDFKGVEEEFADVIIRIMNTAQRLHLRVAEAVIAKQAYNAGRPFKHGGKKF